MDQGNLQLVIDLLVLFVVQKSTGQKQNNFNYLQLHLNCFKSLRFFLFFFSFFFFFFKGITKQKKKIVAKINHLYSCSF